MLAIDDWETPLVAPSGKFTITQSHEIDDGYYNCSSVVTFSNPQFKKIVLEPSKIAWPAVYSISPNGQWIFRIQKTGSGDNTVFLYRVQSDGTITSDEKFGDRAWAYYDTNFEAPGGPYYHMGFDFVEWISPEYLVIALHGSSNEGYDKSLHDFEILYNLKDGSFKKTEAKLPH